MATIADQEKVALKAELDDAQRQLAESDQVRKASQVALEMPSSLFVGDCFSGEGERFLLWEAAPDRGYFLPFFLESSLL